MLLLIFYNVLVSRMTAEYKRSITMTQAQPATIEIRCKKVFVPSKLTASEISKTYGINQAQQTMQKKRIFRKELYPEKDHH